MTRLPLDALGASRGRSAREIGAELFISHGAAATHVASFLAKLDVGTRAEATIAALRQRLV